MTTETLPPALSPEHLTEVLRHAGVLGDGRVSRVAAESWRGKLVSRFLSARLSYAGRADGAPARIFFKTALTDGAINAGEVGRREVEFYRQVAPATARGILPRCFEGVWDAERKDWHLWQADHNLPPVIWWSHLERVLLAVDDLGCRELLE